MNWRPWNWWRTKSAPNSSIAFAGGGALDTVLPGVTGEFFAPQSADALAGALARFDARAYDPIACRAQAERFSRAHFRTALLEYLARPA